MITEISEATERDRALTDDQACDLCGDEIGCVLQGDVPTYESFEHYWVITDSDGTRRVVCERCALKVQP